jgi:hypothetical protein
MKKRLVSFVLLATVFFAVEFTFSSCEKYASNYCAACTEARSGYSPADYCGTSSQVDTYIKELKSQGSAVGQSWSCTKKAGS